MTLLIVGFGGVAESPLVVITASLGFVVGFFAGDVGYALLTRRRLINETRLRQRPTQICKPYSQRLQKFCGRIHVDNSGEFVSKMPLWSRQSSYQRTPPRSPHVIRRILIGIQLVLAGQRTSG